MTIFRSFVIFHYHLFLLIIDRLRYALKMICRGIDLSNINSLEFIEQPIITGHRYINEVVRLIHVY